MKLSSKILLICAFASGIMAYNLRFWLWKGAFYHFTALEFFLLYTIIWNELKGRWKSVAFAMSLVCLDSLLDEMFFDPTKISWQEYVGFGIIILITFIYDRIFRFRG